MATSFSFQQFQSNAENQEVINLQNNLASLEKRLDDLQKSTLTSDATTKMASLENDINSLQHQVDDVAKSGRKDVQSLLAKFNGLKSTVAAMAFNLSKKIDSVDDRVQANTDRDKINECFLHLDAKRYEKATIVADQLSINVVKSLIEDYYNSNTKSNEEKKKVLSEFINHMEDKTRCELFKLLLNNFKDQKPVSHPPLTCRGRQCAACGRCCDWYYDGDANDWEWIRKFRDWDQNTVKRWRGGNYYDKFKLHKNTKCDRSIYYSASYFVRFITVGAFDGSHLIGHLCVCDSPNPKG